MSNQPVESCDWLLSVCPGYAVTAGHFSSPDVIDIAAGAPQHSGSGKVGTLSCFLFPTVQSTSSYVAPVTCFSPAQVYIFKIDGTSLVKSFHASGKMVWAQMWPLFQFNLLHILYLIALFMSALSVNTKYIQCSSTVKESQGSFKMCFNTKWNIPLIL